MFAWLKKYFIPTEINDFQPHFLRIKNIRLILATILIAEAGVLMLPYVISAIDPAQNGYLAAVLPSVLDDLTNQKRQSQNLSVLTQNFQLDKVATLRAQDMAQKGYFSHVSPDGKPPWYWFNLVGYKYEFAGENLAVDFTDSEDVTLAWMNSPTHRANILKDVYTEIGTGIATGTFQGRPTVFVAQVFGKPAKAIRAVTEIANTSRLATSSQEITGQKVLGTSTQSEANVTVDPIIKYIMSPRHIVDLVLIVLGSFLLLALILKFLIRTDKKHPAVITSGFIVLAVIFGAYVVNNYVANNKASKTTSFMEFHVDTFDEKN